MATCNRTRLSHLLKQGAAQIISEAELRAETQRSASTADKTGRRSDQPDIHLGHTVVLRKLRQFQDLGHQAVLIIGDFTAMIGDPSGRSATRPQLTHEQVMEHAPSYREQAFKILDPARTETVSNGDWFKSMSFHEMIRSTVASHCSKCCSAKISASESTKHQPIHAHEIQYPIMQGWDSVMVKADVELGGTDQLFNILVGRDLQREEGLPQQVVLFLPILEGLDGAKKMSKSLGNYIGVNEPASEIFGKLMSISDELMARYYLLLLGRVLPANAHPLEAKKQLALEIVETYHSLAIAKSRWRIGTNASVRNGSPTPNCPITRFQASRQISFR